MSSSLISGNKITRRSLITDATVTTSDVNIIVGTQFESAPSDNNFIGDYRVTQLANGSVDRILTNPQLNNGALLGRHSWKEILN